MERMPKSEARGGLMNAFCRHHLFHWPGYQLLHLLRRSPGPSRRSNGHAHRNTRVLALGHVHVAIPAPHADSDQQNQRNLAVFGEEARRVMGVFDVLGFGFMAHRIGS